MQNKKSDQLMALKLVPIDGGPTSPTGVRNAPRRGLAALLLLILCACGGRGAERIRRAYELGRNPTEPNKGRLAAMLEDPDAEVRTAVLVVMATVDPERAQGLALLSFDDPDGMVRGAAVRVLAGGVFSDPELAQRMMDRAAKDADAQVRRHALESLASLPDDQIRDAAARALSDPARGVRSVALRMGAQRPELLPVDKLAVIVVEDPDWENRIDAARALGLSKDPAAYAPLERAAADGNEFVRAAATRERQTLARDGVVEPPPEEPAAQAQPAGETKRPPGV
jgi:hypothetical protein